MGRLYKAGDAPLFYRIGLIGWTKSGKSSLLTHVPLEWGKGIYFAADPGSEELASTKAAWKERWDRFVPGPEEGARTYDPVDEAMRFAQTDWAAKGYGVVVWDTLTKTTELALNAIAAQGLYGKNIQAGAKTQEGDARVVQPQQGDYGLAQNFASRIADFLTKQRCHVLVGFHPAIDDKDANGMVGGPATVGRAAIGALGAHFNDLFMVAIERTQIPATMPPKFTTKRVVRTGPSGIWMTGIRISPDVTNPGSIEVIEGQPEAFWPVYETLKKGAPK